MEEGDSEEEKKKEKREKRKKNREKDYFSHQNWRFFLLSPWTGVIRPNLPSSSAVPKVTATMTVLKTWGQRLPKSDYEKTLRTKPRLVLFIVLISSDGTHPTDK